MSTHIVERSEEDSFTAVASHVGDLLNEGQKESTELADTPGSRFVADCVTLVGEGRFAELLERLLAQSDLLFGKSLDKDLECSIHVICHLAARVSPAEAGQAAQRVAQSLSAKADSQQEARLQGLSELFNVLTDVQLQYNVLLELLRFSKAVGLAHHLVQPIRTSIDRWPADLHLAPDQTRSLQLLAADVLRAAKTPNEKRRAECKLRTRCLLRRIVGLYQPKKMARARREAYRVTLKTLESLEGASQAEVAACKGAAADAARDFIRSPDTFQFDLLDTPALQQLRSDGDTAPVFSLLSLLLAGDVQAFEQFAQSNTGVFEAIGASREEALTKMRLMALLGMGSQTSSLTFQDVQTALNIGEGEVEVWIVRAIGKKLIDARIDQLAGTVSITRCSHRSFSGAQWAELRSQLGAWKSNVANVKRLVAEQAPGGGISLPALQQGVRA